MLTACVGVVGLAAIVGLGRGRLDEGGVKATPAIAGRSVFLRSESYLYRLEIRP